MQPRHLSYPLAIAHRAGNSLSSLKTALQLEAAMIEIDLNLYRRTIEMRHETNMGALPLVREHWRVQRRPQTPFLLDAAVRSTSLPLMLDLKGSNLALSHAVIAELRQAHPTLQYWVCTRKWHLLEPFLDQPNATVVFSIGNKTELQAALRRFSADSRTDFSVDERLLTPAIIQQLRQCGGRTVAWTVNDPARAKELLRAGIDGITTDSRAVVQAVHRLRSAKVPKSVPQPKG